MKFALSFLFSLVVLFASAQKKYILKAPADKFLVVNGASYQAGDTIMLSMAGGRYKSVLFRNLNGNSKKKIYVTNVRGEVLKIGDTTWERGAWSYGLGFENCHYVKVAGSAAGKFIVEGSKSSNTQGRAAYWNMFVGARSDNFDIHTLEIAWGGTGMIVKTDNVYDNATLNNINIYSVKIHDTWNEAFYIGHTAGYWNTRTNQPYYPKPGDPIDPSIHKLPMKLKNVKFYNNRAWNIGNDAFQFAAIDGLKAYGNEAWNFGLQRNSAHAAGLLLGGRLTNWDAYNNYIHDGTGDACQIFGDSGRANLYNNLFARCGGEGLQIRVTNGAVLNIYNNTVAMPGSNTVRINGYYGGTRPVILKRNLLLQPKFSGPFYPKYYIYTENGGAASDLDNKKYLTVKEANVDERNYFKPNPGSPAAGYGYKR